MQIIFYVFEPNFNCLNIFAILQITEQRRAKTIPEPSSMKIPPVLSIFKLETETFNKRDIQYMYNKILFKT